MADAEQFAVVVGEISTAVTDADAKRDASLLAPRVVGSAAEFRQKAYEIIAAQPEAAPTLATPSSTVMYPMTSVSGTFPRAAIMLVADSVDGGFPLFMALSQADARSPYTSWGWARQLPGVEPPHIEDPTVGADAVAPDADGLVTTPQDALARFAVRLSNGVDAEQMLAADPFTTEAHSGIQDERAKLNQGVAQDSLATIHEEYTVHDGEFAALRTDDGGAIVMGALRSSRTISMKGGATLTANDPEVRLAGKDSFTQELVRDFGEIVALYVPTEDSGAQIQAIGASKILLGVHGS